MNKIDSITWKEFEIGELFITETIKNKKQAPTGASIPKRFLTEGHIPRISATNINNGILGYYEETNNKNYRIFENFISVSFLGTIFYHPYKASLDMKIHCLKLINKDLNKYLAFYLISIIKKVIEETEYSDQISSTVLPNLKIKLPITPTGEPNFSYMENFIKRLFTRERESTGLCWRHLQNVSLSKLDTKKWKEFNVNQLFFEKVVNHKVATYNITDNGKFPVYSSESSNKNCVGYLDTAEFKVDDKIPYYLIFGDHTKSMRIIKEDFSVTDNVKVLIPRNITENSLLFIMCSWFKNIPDLGYSRHWSVAKNTKIKLPATLTDEPDWHYMDKYIATLKNEAHSLIQSCY